MRFLATKNYVIILEVFVLTFSLTLNVKNMVNIVHVVNDCVNVKFYFDYLFTWCKIILTIDFINILLEKESSDDFIVIIKYYLCHVLPSCCRSDFNEAYEQYKK